MTREEVMACYGIPPHILDEYNQWGLCGAVRMTVEHWQYNDQDLERLSTIMALHDIGFRREEVESYMRLLLAGDSTERARLQMLEDLRSRALDEIHLKERQVSRMDYLRHELRKKKP